MDRMGKKELETWGRDENAVSPGWCQIFTFDISNLLGVRRRDYDARAEDLVCQCLLSRHLPGQRAKGNLSRRHGSVFVFRQAQQFPRDLRRRDTLLRKEGGQGSTIGI